MWPNYRPVHGGRYNMDVRYNKDAMTDMGRMHLGVIDGCAHTSLDSDPSSPSWLSLCSSSGTLPRGPVSSWRSMDRTYSRRRSRFLRKLYKPEMGLFRSCV